jgi:hypothetical protein
LIISNPMPAAYPPGKYPDLMNSFKDTISIQTYDMSDSTGKVGNRTLLLRDPVCNGRPCNLFGESHTAGIRFLTRLFEINLPLAKLLFECQSDTLNLQDQGLGLYDGYLTWQGSLFTQYFEHLTLLLNEFATAINPLNRFPIAIVRPVDPNEKVSPIGFGPSRLVEDHTPLEYTI